ncbi:MAG: chemotaxis protein methyltransferase CheR [Ramlibacter sp.]|jgi:signal transduction histidine kinase/ActR/RegA family two-component response regulator|nr:chemotaxis protein methyltransferase CheR [Ramlibacter sp.]MCE3270087.1 chemotaxis protein methyltransferase CheR [Ramlibacter sp.]
MKFERPGRTLRFRLFLLAASGLLPLAIVAAVVLAYLAGERERDTQENALAVSRALATAVDSELRASAGVLESLALANELQPARLADFHSLAGRIAARQDWRAIVLAGADGRVILTSSRPFGGPPEEPVDPESMRRALASRAPVVGKVAVGRMQVGPAFAVRVPVLHDGQLPYVISAVIPVERVLAVVQRQKMPATSVVAVFDQELNRVARSQQHTVGRPSPSLQRLLARGGPEGVGPTVTLEGVPSQTAFVRLEWSNWVVATGISAHDRGLYGVLGAVAAGLLASLALAAFFATYFASHVTGPIDTLKAAAAAMGRGEPVKVPTLEISELQDVGDALEIASAERERASRERLAAEAERETLLARATEALQQAEEAGRSKDEFLAMLGHELRNPLAPMATALHLMARKGEPGTRLEREVMERQVAHMKRLVDDLLDVSRITGKRLAIRMEPLRLAEVVRHGAQSVQPVLGLRRFDLDIPRDAEQLWVAGDEVRLGQVLSNLLGNAVKFTGPEGTISVRLERSGDHAQLTVADTGFGMTPEVLEHVFDLFYQAPQGTDRSRGGLGLGLAIVRSLVEMHGGTVQADSEGEGHGSRLVVRLPLAMPPPEPTPSQPAALATGSHGRVLLVDDNKDAADTAGALLEISGYEVRIAYDPGVALTLLDDFVPDVAVLDIGLPGMSGHELAARVRAHRNGGTCYLVALTGYGTSADVARAHEAGFSQHLVKPAGPGDLLDAVERGVKDSMQRKAS